MKYLLNLILLLYFMFGVGCKQQVNKNDDQDSTAFQDSDLGFGTEKLNEVYYRFPSPEEMMSMLDKSDLMYNGEILNSPIKAKKYLNSRSQALNVGVYSADLAYILLFEKHNMTVGYFEALFNLTRDLRISAAFDLNLLKRIQKNAHDIDSLKQISEYTFTRISDYLASSNKEKIFAIISIGGFVEALYLSFNMANDFSERNIIVQRIADQKLVLDNIVNYSRAYMDDQAVQGALEYIVPIRKVYNELIAVPEETNVSKTEDGKLIISGGSRITINEEQYARLKDATFKVRKEITLN